MDPNNKVSSRSISPIRFPEPTPDKGVESNLNKQTDKATSSSSGVFFNLSKQEKKNLISLTNKNQIKTNSCKSPVKHHTQSTSSSNDASGNSQSGFCKCRLCNSVAMNFLTYASHVLGKKHKKKLSSKSTPMETRTIKERSLHITGYKPKTSAETILMKFWPIEIKDFIYKGSFSYIEFYTVNDKEIASKQEIYIDGRKLILSRKLHQPVQFNSNSIDLPPISDMLKNWLSEVSLGNQLHNKITSLLSEIALKPQDYYNRNYVCSKVESSLQMIFPGTRAYLFGSSVNNLGFVGSDVDLYVDLGIDPWENGTQLEKEKAAADLTMTLFHILKKGRMATNIFPIPRARVPIVKFMETQTGLHVDLSFRNQMPVANSNLILLYTQAHPIVHPYLLLVRYWALVQGISGGGKPSLLITNYALTMMMLYVLMQPHLQIIPTVSQLREDYKKFHGYGVNSMVLIGDWDCSFSTNVEMYQLKRHSLSILDLFKEFLNFYSNLETTKWVVSPLTGELISRETLGSKTLERLPKIYRYYCCICKDTIDTTTPLCVQDPFDHSHNLTRGLDENSLSSFKKKCSQSLVIIDKISSGMVPLLNLFQSIDLEDLENTSDMNNTSDEIDLVSNDSQQSVECIDNDEVVILKDENSKIELETFETKTIQAEVHNAESGKLNENFEKTNENLKMDLETFETKTIQVKECIDNDEIVILRDENSKIELETFETKTIQVEVHNDESGKLNENLKMELETFETKTIQAEECVDNDEVVLLKDENLDKTNENSKIELKTFEAETIQAEAHDDESVKLNENLAPSTSCSTNEPNKSKKDFADLDASMKALFDSVVDPEKEEYHFKLSLTPVSDFMIGSDGSIDNKSTRSLSLDEMVCKVCEIVEFALKNCLKMNFKKVNSFDEYSSSEKRKRFEFDNRNSKNFKDLNGSVVNVKKKYNKIAQYTCNTKYTLWSGRKKASKELVLLNNSPLQHEKEVTLHQLKKSENLTSPVALYFLLTVWQDTLNKRTVCISAKHVPYLNHPKILLNPLYTKNRMNPMFFCLSSLVQTLFRRILHYVSSLQTKSS